MSLTAFIRWTELDRTGFPAWRDGILDAEATGAARPGEPRSYPDYPRWPLERARPRLFAPLDRALAERRCRYPPGETVPSKRNLSRLLQRAHGITGKHSAGPTPSAGGLQALELYLAIFQTGWLPTGFYHYDRAGHHLSQIVPDCSRQALELHVPSLQQMAGGAFLWIVVGDAERVCTKYADRGFRFLLLEAGHLMQSLCLLSTSLGLITVPIGGFFERALAKQMNLPGTDVVLYAGVCGSAPRD
jgi:SagB-type dehydrogenase family enzyme